MRTIDLVRTWSPEPPRSGQYSLRLPLKVAAKIEALSEIFGGKERSEILVGLISAALDQLDQDLPAESRQDENDVGLSRTRYLMLVEKHLKAKEREVAVFKDSTPLAVVFRRIDTALPFCGTIEEWAQRLGVAKETAAIALKRFGRRHRDLKTGELVETHQKRALPDGWEIKRARDYFRVYGQPGLAQ